MPVTGADDGGAVDVSVLMLIVLAATGALALRKRR
jgi:hypothetical protein